MDDFMTEPDTLDHEFVRNDTNILTLDTEGMNSEFTEAGTMGLGDDIDNTYGYEYVDDDAGSADEDDGHNEVRLINA